MENRTIVNRGFEKVDDKLVVSSEVEIVYDIETLYYERQALARDRLQIVNQSQNLKEQYQEITAQILQVEEMITILEDDGKADFEELV